MRGPFPPHNHRAGVGLGCIIVRYNEKKNCAGVSRDVGPVVSTDGQDELDEGVAPGGQLRRTHHHQRTHTRSGFTFVNSIIPNQLHAHRSALVLQCGAEWEITVRRTDLLLEPEATDHRPHAPPPLNDGGQRLSSILDLDVLRTHAAHTGTHTKQRSGSFPLTPTVLSPPLLCRRSRSR